METGIPEGNQLVKHPDRMKKIVKGSRLKPTVAVLFAVVAMAGSGVASEWKPATNTIMTRWAKEVAPDKVLPEYPRPQMVRPQWQNLNGLWDYAVTNLAAPQPDRFTGKIMVPFCIESALSGVKTRFNPDERLWYRLTFTAPALAGGKRLLLHFGAVDWETRVIVNGKPVGTHKGGYDAFTFDITDSVKPATDNELVVAVMDETGGMQPKGKQKLGAVARSRSIRYTPCSGIWQTVWLEEVPATHIESLKIVPDTDQGIVRITVLAVPGKDDGNLQATVEVYDGQAMIGATNGAAGQELAVRIPNAKLWSPDSPFLYDLKVTAGGQRLTAQPDKVSSYFGMRRISLGKDEKGFLRPLLNGKFVFHSGLLDQGYWPDGIYTAPTDDALKYDIEMTRKLGFNMARKHVKIEPARWYYWCDKLGVLVWQDMPSGLAGSGAARDGKDGAWRDGVRASDAANAQFECELKAMVEQHWNHPSVVVWVVFNEGWGQYDTPRLTKLVKDLDPSRLVNSATGGHDILCGDFTDVHHYPGPVCPKAEPARTSALGEFGGYGLSTPGHTLVEAAWGYRGVPTPDALTGAFVDVWRGVWTLKDTEGLSAAVYTQTTDVEAECNGLITYDRELVKPDAKKVADAAMGKFPPAP